MRKKILFLIIFFFILCANYEIYAQSSIEVIPSSIKAPREERSIFTINYRIVIDPYYHPLGTYTSDKGEFLVRGNVIGTVNKPLSVTILSADEIGWVSEHLIIPVAVIERALNRGSNIITYQRIFSNYGYYLTANLTIYITTEAGAEFKIKRIELYFNNKRAEITVPRNFKGLKAYANIRYIGSGLLRGYWEVDGRILSYVNQHLVYAGKITLQTPDIPPLPTYDTGYHIVRFVIENPEFNIPVPEIVYFVTPEEFKQILSLKLISPEKGETVKYLPLKFEWTSLNKSSLYLIQFFDNPEGKPIFSAYTKHPYYNLPEFILKKIFVPEKTYYWKVTGFDQKNNIIGESELWNFIFESPQSYVPGEILIAFKAKKNFSENYAKKLKKLYGFQEITKFFLKSINLRVIIFKSLNKTQNIFEIIKKLEREPEVVFAQPNFIFKTFSDPLRKRQIYNDMLFLDKIHLYYTGKDVKVAVIDTGVDIKHEDLKDRIILYKNFIRGEKYKCEIHGTAVAGIIAASTNGVGIEGVAPEAELLALRACQQINKESPMGKCFTETIARALDEAIQNRVQLINMSFGVFKHDRLISRLIEKGISQGILFVAPIGYERAKEGITFPASHPFVISVGGIDENGNPYPTPEVAEKADILAPAVNVFTTIPNNKYNFLTGTSFSSAYITGLLALAAEKENLSKEKLPSFRGDFCRWEEELLKIHLCKQ
ncbi:MAG: Serine protease [Thermodesulfobacterium sp.]|uniref:Serine protease n=1 Tax=Candidatus Thermodesulfobacterium syntrophicum TaxID=3060442 RepID=A0AAE3P2T6_9BACT|nr:Serine protease [Candidatus Thermodesulfobacterium syntrophicum]